ncbi:hypothetical protein ACFXD5_33400 [Streptomyces sp. NPDC059385]|uniref:hypothetical protein n=1 Tax=Streptomyces sp. NPDC059385 TaxID=3346817 RepID=UPI00368AC597
MKSVRDKVLRSFHDVGPAAWFGGSLMGTVGLNGAAKNHSESWKHNAALASSGWRRWTPVGGAAIGVHLVGSAGPVAANTAPVATQPSAVDSRQHTTDKAEALMAGMETHR